MQLFPSHDLCEIGVREGYGTHVITDSLKDKNYFHIGIDPYGDLVYKHIDKEIDHDKGTIAHWTIVTGKLIFIF